MSKKKLEHESSVEIVGRLGRDPVFKETDKGVPYAKLSVATTERLERAGDTREHTEWHNATVWGDKAGEIAGQFKKGDSVVLSGDLRINSYEKDGAKNRVSEITVKEMRPNVDKAVDKNETKIVGVVREDPKGREVGDGKQMTTLSVATTTMQNGREREEWHNVTAWGDKAVAARQMKAGDVVQIEGPVKHRSFDDKEHEGVKRKVSSIECQRFQVLEKAKELAVAPQVRKPRKGVEQGM